MTENIELHNYPMNWQTNQTNWKSLYEIEFMKKTQIIEIFIEPQIFPLVYRKSRIRN